MSGLMMTNNKTGERPSFVDTIKWAHAMNRERTGGASPQAPAPPEQVGAADNASLMNKKRRQQTAGGGYTSMLGG